MQNFTTECKKKTAVFERGLQVPVTRNLATEFEGQTLANLSLGKNTALRRITFTLFRFYYCCFIAAWRCYLPCVSCCSMAAAFINSNCSKTPYFWPIPNRARARFIYCSNECLSHQVGHPFFSNDDERWEPSFFSPLAVTFIATLNTRTRVFLRSK